tara:strand:+ start:919 stop:1485 length:567 start_codon:yes stop_codon:yes gene_type:complete
MRCEVYCFQKNDIKAYDYHQYADSINEIVDTLNNLRWDSLVNEYNNVVKGNKSITNIVKAKVFRLLHADLDYEFTNVDNLSSPRLKNFKIIKDLGVNNRLYYQCFKNDIYITFTNDNIGFVENKIFKGLLIRERINPNALSVLITISDEVLEAGGYDSVSITYNKVIKYTEAYQNFINFPIAIIGIHP